MHARKLVVVLFNQVYKDISLTSKAHVRVRDLSWTNCLEGVGNSIPVDLIMMHIVEIGR
jgi:hypothetical protein